ncbi:MAG: J domain-containing protein [Bauldia sp.]|nr:J domain-containing protein [Bauldia sp.]
MRDPYDVLGIARTASHADVKKAFRRLAKKYHPDQNPEDKKAKERFSEINDAYEILGDETKRAQFDRGEIGADGKPRFQGFEGFGAGGGGFRAGEARSGGFGFGTRQGPGAAGYDDILSDILGGGFTRTGRTRTGRAESAAPRGGDVTAQLAVTLEQLARSEKVRVDLPTGKTVEMALPAGTRSGQTIRLKGQGHASLLGGAPGDALVTVEFVPHPLFRIDGDALRLDLPVSLDVAVLGGKVRVETLDGPVTMTIPPRSRGARALRLKGKGLPRAGGDRGDLLVTPSIVLPEQPDPELEALMRRWREEGRGEPRPGEVEI